MYVRMRHKYTCVKRNVLITFLAKRCETEDSVRKEAHVTMYTRICDGAHVASNYKACIWSRTYGNEAFTCLCALDQKERSENVPYGACLVT